MTKFTTTKIFETATSDAGMTKLDAARFHAFNPNGAIASLPAADEFSFKGVWFMGAKLIYGRPCGNEGSYHARKLQAYASGYIKKFSRWEVSYHVNGVRSDAEMARKVIAAKRAEIDGRS